MRRLLNYLSLIVLTTAASGVAARQAPVRSPRIANYTIEAALDPAGRRLQGTGRLEWRNATSTPATELRFHLYWNAWRDDGSTWMRSRTLAGDTSLQDRSDADRGYTTTIAGVTWDLSKRTTLALDYQVQLPDERTSIPIVKTVFLHYVASF
jgi:hypothetical protein